MKGLKGQAEGGVPGDGLCAICWNNILLGWSGALLWGHFKSPGGLGSVCGEVTVGVCHSGGFVLWDADIGERPTGLDGGSWWHLRGD